ncbi:restriction endonuclease subunit S [Sphingobacterium haloxyli]|uniref:Restriction endonuclease subunit S n=1 Tax=Sphingobacterium haloxyli TaxID=2100533 RepID=A0A2S9IZX3_9SPHI|nr:restriction endonuclease subunit S [Sphingobacterium haloxyli]PRD46086.1 restriction endonuclease subunit S [Sphingobacterium haloxyli]
MKSYDTYKESGIEWVGEIPSHWEEKRMRFLGYLYGGLSGKSANDFNQLSNSENKSFIPFTNIANNLKIDVDNLQTVVISENESQNKVQKGDLFFLMSSENYEDVGKSAVLTSDLEETYLNSFCKGFRISDENIVPEFLNYQLFSKPLRHNLLTGANGFTRINLKIDKVNDLRVTLPPQEEQTAIAFYLDRKTDEIDALIADKKRLLELYEEEKITIINQAVTKGIDPKVKMKDSGIEWLGQIPEHWEVKRMKNICTVRQGLQISIEKRFLSKVDNSFEYITIRSINNPDQAKEYIEKPSPNVICNKDDILMARTGATGEPITGVEGVFHNNFFLIDFNRELVDKMFLFYFLKSGRIKEYLLLMAGTTTIPDLNHGAFYNTPFFQYSLEEQQSIVYHIETECTRIDAKIAKTQKLIELLTEYRTALISEVVTGKIKVID